MTSTSISIPTIPIQNDIASESINKRSPEFSPHRDPPKRPLRQRHLALQLSPTPAGNQIPDEE